MLRFVFPSESNREDVLAFYAAFEKNGGQCIGCKYGKDYTLWLTDMQNRRAGKNLPQGYVQENFYLCYSGEEMVGVCSLKLELTEYLLQYGGHVEYAVHPALQNRGYGTEILAQTLRIAREPGFHRLLCVCDEDNYASEKIILKNGDVLENTLYDPEEAVTVKRYWIDL